MRAALVLPHPRVPARARALPAALAVVAVLAGACASPAMPAPTPAAPATASPAAASPSPTAPAPPSTSPLASATPGISPLPSTGQAVVTRVVVPDLGIDLPVVKAPSGYPYCNVAMYFGPPMGQPGEGRATYIFAHARDGMFGPIYRLVMLRRTPNRMVGMPVLVYTSDDTLWTYRIQRVYPHQLTLDRPLAATTDQLWLQTSEGPHGTPGKTQVLAIPVSITMVGHAEANPKPHIVHCG